MLKDKLNISIMKNVKQRLRRFNIITSKGIVKIHRACNVCNSSAPLEVSELKTDKVKNQNKFNKIYQATVINMKETDNEPKYSALLVLSDKYTNFVFMRPLPKIHEDFIAIELVKLFADYGHPCIIETTLKAIFSPVIKLLPNFGNAFTINIIQSPFTDNSWHQRALVYLQEWMSINETENWVSGCPIVQWQLNNLRRRDNTTPYKQVFGVDPVRDLITSYTKL
ncbi:uncharacterized protein LOC114351418 [Ostrinia furnacalis]|uniref:uncharacterized protein LOC114351418 n=1 Tax=Ostrinia furnacalis TaxID=93504 RepID=UPI001038897E|nr:uncharacterized protein LOC114351418 [Ostrinia furnacalis]